MKSTFILTVLLAVTLTACGPAEPEEAPAPSEVNNTVAPAPPEPAPPVVSQSNEPEPAAPTPAPVAAPPLPQITSPVPAAPPPANLAQGRQTYQQACAFCHDKGVAGAPKLGDQAAWSARLAQGSDALYAAALRGKGAMPAKGGNPSLSDDAVKSAVDHLVSLSR